MAKVNLVDIANLSGNPISAQNNINSNSATIEAAFDNTLSRDGSAPNQMNASFDMNGNEIINVGPPTGPNSGARLLDITNTLGTGATAMVVVTFDNTGAPLTTGATKTYLSMGFKGNITGWTVAGSPSGSVVIDIWKAAGVIPTIVSSIIGAHPPNLTSQTFFSGVPNTWTTTTVAIGDIFEFAITSVSLVQKAILTLNIQRT